VFWLIMLFVDYCTEYSAPLYSLGWWNPAKGGLASRILLFGEMKTYYPLLLHLYCTEQTLAVVQLGCCFQSTAFPGILWLAVRQHRHNSIEIVTRMKYQSWSRPVSGIHGLKLVVLVVALELFG
jgi:hypothetical protein